jgi:hypothetical protein
MRVQVEWLFAFQAVSYTQCGPAVVCGGGVYFLDVGRIINQLSVVASPRHYLCNCTLLCSARLVLSLLGGFAHDQYRAAVQHHLNSVLNLHIFDAAVHQYKSGPRARQLVHTSATLSEQHTHVRQLDGTPRVSFCHQHCRLSSLYRYVNTENPGRCSVANFLKFYVPAPNEHRV